MRKPKLTSNQVAAFRMRRHHFTDPADLGAVCSDVCGIHAQVMSAAHIALWSRLHHLTREEIRSALLDTRILVRTSVMRQTLHLLAAADFPIYITALRRSRVAAIFHIMSKFGIQQHEADQLNESVVRALADGPLTQQELAGIVKPTLGKKMRAWADRVFSILRLAIVEGLICYGQEQGSQATFVRVDQWLPKQRRIAEDHAQQTLLRRYLRAYGPATVSDFAKWTGFRKPEAKAVWAGLQDEMVEVDIEGDAGWVLREDLAALKDGGDGGVILRLVPSFDPYMLGHVSKDHLFDPVHYKKVFRSAWWISPVVLLNGRVAGIWSSRRQGKKLSIEIEAFEKLAKSIRATIGEEAESLAEFLNQAATIRFTAD